MDLIGHILVSLSPSKNNILVQGTTSHNITIKYYQLEMVNEFIYLGSTTSNKLNLDKEKNIRIEGYTILISSTFACLGTSVWKNPNSLSTTRCQCITLSS